MKHNISARNNQPFFQYYYLTVNWMRGISPELKDSEHLLVKHKFTKNSRKILMTLLRYMGVNHQTYVSQELIAIKSGVHHDTVNRTLKLFHLLGIIKKKYRGANKTCLYSFGSFLHDPSVKYALRDLIPNLYWSIESNISICKKMLTGLLSPVANVFRQNTARLFNNNNKDTLYTHRKEKMDKKIQDFVPDFRDIEKYREYEEKEKEKKNNFAVEMAQLLGLSA